MSEYSRLRTLADLRHELDRYTLVAATGVFTLLAAAVATGGVLIPGGLMTLLLYPAGLLGVTRLRPESVLHPDLRAAAGWAFLVVIAFIFVPSLLSPGIAVGLPAALALGLLIAKFPAAATVVLMLLTGVLGSFQAFLGVSPSLIVDLLLAGIWLVLLARLVLGRPYRFVVWPAVAGCGLYIGLTAIDMITSDQPGLAWYGFHTTVWYMLGAFALAYAGWSRQTYRRIAMGFAWVAVLVAGYATLRWIIGPSGVEREQALTAAGGINLIPPDGHLRAVGSFFTGHQLAFWVGFMAPFCLAVALWARGRPRAVALAGVLLCVLAAIASEARAPLGGLVAGVVVILGLYQCSRAFPGFKAGVVLFAIIATAGVASTVFVLGETDPERLERYTNIVQPGNDPTFIGRQTKWDQIIPEIEERPFGHGLGTGGQGQLEFGETIEKSEIVIDNSFLMIAYEQGIFVMALFAAVILALLVSLALAAVRTPSREAAAFGLGACGALVSTMVSFYTGPYYESTPVVASWLIVGLGLSYFVAHANTASVPTPTAALPQSAAPVGTPA